MVLSALVVLILLSYRDIAGEADSYSFTERERHYICRNSIRSIKVESS
jgi:hypothetical protein